MQSQCMLLAIASERSLDDVDIDARCQYREYRETNSSEEVRHHAHHLCYLIACALTQWVEVADIFPTINASSHYKPRGL